MELKRIRKAAYGDKISFILNADTANNGKVYKASDAPSLNIDEDVASVDIPITTTTTTTTTDNDDWDHLFDDWDWPETSVATESSSTETSIPTTTRGVSAALKGLQNLFVKYNVPVIITSDYRAAAKTKQGRQSHHATGNAMDIIPKDGHDFAEIAKIIRETPEIKTYMQQHGYGVLDETTEAMLKRTGGTGAHYHIGPDRIAQKFWEV